MKIKVTVQNENDWEFAWIKRAIDGKYGISVF